MWLTELFKYQNLLCLNCFNLQTNCMHNYLHNDFLLSWKWFAVRRKPWTLFHLCFGSRCGNRKLCLSSFHLQVGTLCRKSVSAVLSNHVFCDFKLSFVIKNNHLIYLQLDNIELDEKQHHLNSFGLTFYSSCTNINGLFPTLITCSRDAYRIAYWQILLFHYAVIQYFFRKFLYTCPIMACTTEVFFFLYLLSCCQLKYQPKGKW